MKCTPSHFMQETLYKYLEYQPQKIRVSVISIGVPVLTSTFVVPMSLSFSFELFGLSSNEISSPTRGSTVR